MSSVKAAVRRLRGDQAGFSLVEELVSLAILAFAVGIVITGIFTATQGSKVKQGSVSSQTLSRSQMELILDGSYQADPTVVPYPTVEPVAGYTVEVVVEYWTAPSGPFASTVRNDGLQRVTVSVSDGGGQLQQLQAYVVDR